MTIEIYN